MKSVVKIWFFLIVLCISHQHCIGKSLYVEYEEDEAENDPGNLRRGGGGGNSIPEIPTEGNLVSHSSFASRPSSDTPETFKISSSGDLNDVKIGTSLWTDDRDVVDESTRMSPLLTNYGPLLRRKSTRSYGRWTMPYDTNFRPWSSRQKNFFGNGGPNKRQISYRQCFFNPIACF